MRIIIDRFEGDIAVVETDGEMYEMPRALLGEAREGDAVEISVIGRACGLDDEPPSDIFERLRGKTEQTE